MIEPKFFEMMNMELDGVLPEKDRTRLHDYLSSVPEANIYFEGLRAAVEAANSVEQVEPPAGLINKIMNAVPFSHHQVEAPHKGFTNWRENWFTMPRFRYAAVFVFGIVFGVLVYSAMNLDSERGAGELNVSKLLGTMKQYTELDGFTQTGAFGVDLDRVQGSVSLHESDKVLLAEVALDASDDIDWVVEYDAGDVTFDGYRSFDGGAGDVVAAKTEMRVHQTGDSRYLLIFTRKSHPVTPFKVRIYSADQLLLENTLSPAAKSAD
jgi:hypothetical protein